MSTAPEHNPLRDLNNARNLNSAELSASYPPGSVEAIARGCSCPILDNGRGRGYMGMPGIYVYAGDCQLHGANVANEGHPGKGASHVA
jgi:hypothetical protein